MKPVGDHQFDLIFFRGGDHCLAIFLGHGHRLFTQNVDTCIGGCFGIGAMHVIGKRDIDGIYLTALQAFGILFVGIGARDTIFLAELFEFGGIVGNQGGQFRIAGVGEGRQHRVLGDVAQSYHGVADLLTPYRVALLSL